MLRLFLVAALLSLGACSSTKVYYPDGKLAFYTSADGRVKFAGGKIKFDGVLDHSTPTKARGDAVAARIQGVAGLATALGGAALFAP